ncbi:hypothetical protein AN643_04395 [Candidatus Epulonipiscioides saccharophilum]|nr:hypothetical protein AN643_04395 [Epulopiscium sp. SCG-B10WGA-EpuloB]
MENNVTKDPISSEENEYDQLEQSLMNVMDILDKRKNASGQNIDASGKQTANNLMLKSLSDFFKQHNPTEVSEQVQLDGIVKALLELSPECILGTINECFNTKYALGTTKINYLKTNFIDTNFKETGADLVMDINSQIYHLEIQTINDKNMQSRLLDYGLAVAKMNSPLIDGYKVMSIPSQAVIFIEENKKIINQRLMLESNNEKLKHSIQTIRFWEYSVESLIQKKMYCLLPIVLFQHRKSLKNIVRRTKNSTVKRSEALNSASIEIQRTVKTISDTIEQLYKKSLILDNDALTMLEAVQNLTNYFGDKYFNNQILKEKVNTMVQKLYNPILAKQSKEEGLKEGLEKGRAEGEIKVLYTRMKMSDQEISKELKMPLETVKEIIKELKL